MDWARLPLVAFDTETTGLTAWRGDRIIEFSAVRFRLDPGGAVQEDRIERRTFRFHPGIPIPREVVRQTGITDEAVADAPRFEAHAREVRDLLADGVTVAHNYPFDLAMLTAEFARAGLAWPAPPAEIDTLALSRRLHPEASRHGLADVATRLGVRLEEAHRAEQDAEACGRVFLALARHHAAPTDLDALIEWADGVGRPPPGGPVAAEPSGRLVFTEGPHAGEPVERHPDHLAWLAIARTRIQGTWQHRYPESVRRWVGRWLRNRAAGHAMQSGRSFGPEDWAPVSCALPDRAVPGRPAGGGGMG